jgi:hypothetical protein
MSLGGVVDMELVQRVAMELAMGQTDLRSIDENYNHLGPDFYNAVLNFVNPTRIKPALQTPTPTPVVEPTKPNFTMPTYNETSTTDSGAKISLQTSSNSVPTKVAPIIREMPINYANYEVKQKTDEEAAKSTNKMWAWIAGTLAVVGIYSFAKKGKGLSGLGCPCDGDDKPKPMAGVKTKKSRKKLSLKM